MSSIILYQTLRDENIDSNESFNFTDVMDSLKLNFDESVNTFMSEI